MIGLIVAVVLALGVGGTVQVADNARPGDALFGVDQAVESLQLKLANDEKEGRLRVKFAKERVAEIEELVADEETSDDDSEEVAKTEDSGAENEQGESDDAISEDEKDNIEIGIEAALNLLAGLEELNGENTEITGIVEKLNSFIATLPTGASVEVEGNKLRIEFEDEATGEEVKVKYDVKNDRLKTEIESEEGRIKIEIKDGTLEIKSRVEDDSEEDEDSSAKSGLQEAEAKIFSDKTIVEVEVGDQKTTFTTSANTREAVVAAIVAKISGLTSAQVDAVLKLETEGEDEEEGAGDSSDDSDDEDDEDEKSDDSDEGEDKDDDDKSGSNSGSGGGDND